MKRGFSLAEILITLGIIATIATVSLPTLNSNTWKGQREALYKAAYARVKTAMDAAIQDLHYIPQCAYYRPGANPYELQGIQQIRTEDKATGEVTWSLQKDGKEYKLPTGETFNGRFNECEILGNAITNGKVEDGYYLEGTGEGVGIILTADQMEGCVLNRPSSPGAQHRPDT